MNRIEGLIGREHSLDHVAQSLREFSAEVGARVVGAYHLTCSDETERECAQVFQRLFVESLLPPLKPNARWPFRTANLGARYEWGAIRVAEEHYATESAQSSTKLIVAKLNSHVAARQSGEGWEYGSLTRYQRESTCCGALNALLDGAVLPALEDLRHTFQSGGINRLGMLRDRRQCPHEQRALLAAVVNARLQADRLVLDTQETRPESPTIFLVLPCVTVNRPATDTELVVGQYGVDWTGPQPEVKYVGLGSDPASYRIRHERNLLVIEEAE